MDILEADIISQIYDFSPFNVFQALLGDEQMGEISYTVKKGKRFSRPQPGCHLPNSPWPGIIKYFLAKESLVSDILARDGKIANLFLQCIPHWELENQDRRLVVQERPTNFIRIQLCVCVSWWRLNSVLSNQCSLCNYNQIN